MQQALFKCEMPQLELKSLWSFLAIKRCQGTKSKKVIKLARSSLIKVAHVICANRGISVKQQIGIRPLILLTDIVFTTRISIEK
jgi:hypothetical protein